MNIHIGILADDLTGAVDSSLAFWEHTIPSTILLDDAAMPVRFSEETSTLALDTNTRHDIPEVAHTRVLAATNTLRTMGATLLYKKIDSTLRGNIGTEVEAMLAASEARQAIVCPAFPATGRTVVEGRVLVHGVDLLKTAFASDPRHVVSSSRVASVLATQTHLPIAELSSPSHVADAHNAAIVVVDAQTDDQLRAWISAVGLKRDLLWVGSAGLAGALAATLQARGRALSRAYTTQRLPAARATLVVVGSIHPTSREQLEVLGGKRIEISLAYRQAASCSSEQAAKQIIEALLHEGRAILTVDPIPVDGLIIENILGEVVASVAARLPAAPHLVLAGGDTARAVLKRLGIARLHIVGAVAPGIPIAETPDRAVRVITKAGGFGTPDVLLRAVRILQEGESETLS